LLDIFGEAPVAPSHCASGHLRKPLGKRRSDLVPPRAHRHGARDDIVDPDTGRLQYNFCCLFGVASGRRSQGVHRLLQGHGNALRPGRRPFEGRRQALGRPRTVARMRAQALEAAVAVAGDGTVGVT